ncbi:MAG: serpin family protein [Synergistaceae bacterium]|jgi:serpin B|nr:serpin family protein [Synergistaceae bacterium]
MRFVSVVLCFLCLSVSRAWGAAPPETQAVAAAVNAFALDAYRQLAKDEKGNIFFSPYSISSALATVWAGAAGSTAEEMAAALHFPKPEALHTGMKYLMERFNATPEKTGVMEIVNWLGLGKKAGALEIANRLWLDKGEKPLPEYAALVEANYGADVGSVDFQQYPEEARKEINRWVERKTRDKIKELLMEGNVTPNTRLVLTNAIYFNSAWRHPFEKSDTEEKPFRIGKGRQINVPLMKQTQKELLYGELFYGEKLDRWEPDLQWVKIPYATPDFSLLVLLPKENETFTQMELLEKKLSPEAIAAWVARMGKREVKLWLPKFRDERRYSLKGLLQKLGIKLAFTQEADFSRMAEAIDDPLYVDSVVHQSFIELDEEGTKVAVGMMWGSAVASAPVYFRADHPFIYCLMDDATGTILFLGRMVEPASL